MKQHTDFSVFINEVNGFVITEYLVKQILLHLAYNIPDKTQDIYL